MARNKELQKLTSSDSVGGDMKASLAQVVALEMSRSSVRDSRTVVRFYSFFKDCISNVLMAVECLRNFIAISKLISLSYCY